MYAWWNELSGLGRVFACVAVPASVVLALQTLLMLIGGLGGHNDTDMSSDTSGIGDSSGMDAGGHDVDVGHDLDAGHDFDGGHDLDAGHDFDGGHDLDAGHEGLAIDGGHTGGGVVHDSSLRVLSLQGLITFFTIFGWGGLAGLQGGLSPVFAILTAAAGGAAAMFLTAFVLAKAQKLTGSGNINLQNALGKTATVYIRIPAKRGAAGKVTLVVQDQLIEVDAYTDADADLTSGMQVAVVGLASSSALLVTPKA